MCNCVRPGRVFISHMLTFLRGMKGKEQKITNEFKKDVKWWINFMPRFSGTCILWMLHIQEPDSEVASDTSFKGMGAVCGKEYIKVCFPEWLSPPKYSIAHMELWAIIVMVKTWSHCLSGKSILI